MWNFALKLDLLRLKNSKVIKVKDDYGEQEGIFIPVSENEIYLSKKMDGSVKSAYIDFMAYNNKKVIKYGNTHIIKQLFNKDVITNMDMEERNSLPIIGNMKPKDAGGKDNDASYTLKQKHNKSTYQSIVDDLPF